MFITVIAFLAIIMDETLRNRDTQGAYNKGAFEAVAVIFNSFYSFLLLLLNLILLLLLFFQDILFCAHSLLYCGNYNDILELCFSCYLYRFKVDWSPLRLPQVSRVFFKK
jgi:hypothetical protein